MARTVSSCGCRFIGGVDEVDINMVSVETRFKERSTSRMIWYLDRPLIVRTWTDLAENLRRNYYVIAFALHRFTENSPQNARCWRDRPSVHRCWHNQ